MSGHPPPPACLRRALAFSVFLSALAGLAACSPADSAEGPGGPGGPPAVSVVAALQRPVQASEDFIGRVEALQTVALRSQVAGTLEQVHFRDGQRVAKGALLFSIDARPFRAELARAEAQLASARTRVELAAAERVRAEKLLPMQAVSEQEVDQLRAAERDATATVRSAEAALAVSRLNLAYTRIHAPVAGRMADAEVTPGNLVGVGEPVLSTLVASDQVYVWFDANESTYLRLSEIRRQGPVTVTVGLVDEDGFPHKGQVDFVDNRLNPGTGSARVRARLDNAAGRFTPGLSARVQLALGAPAPAILVPDRAIGTDQTRKQVLVVGKDNIVAPRPVQLGALDGAMRIVTGLQAGELVIVDGLQRAFPGAPVTPTVLKVDAQGMPVEPAPQAQKP